MSSVRPQHAYLPGLVLLIAAFPGIIPAQSNAYIGRSVVNIRFDPPRQPIEGEELFQILPLKRGQPLSMDVVRESIARLFATGRYADIQVDAEPYNQGVIVTFRTRNSWFVGNVSAGGKVNDPPTAGQLVNASRLELGTAYSDASLDQAVNSQRRLLEGNGLFTPAVRPVFDYDDRYQQIHIRFQIESGRRARFAPPDVTGDLKVSLQRIVAATKFRRWIIHTWKPMTQARVSRGLEGIRNLYQKENRLEAKVTLESVRYDPARNAAIPVLRIEAGPRIQVNPVGYKFPKRRLQRLIPIYEEHAVDHDLLVEGAGNLRDYLQSQGYFEAQVEFKEQAVIRDRASLDFLIATGRRHKLVSITIDGNHYFSTETLRSRMFLQTANFLQFPHGRFSGSLLRRDEDTIRNVYESNGFRDVKVTAVTQDDYRGNPGELAVALHIEEGRQYLVNSVQLEGVEKLNRESLLARLSSTQGQPFSEFNVALDRDAILARYFESGFPKATFEWNSKPSANDPYRLDVVFKITEGQQQFVREVVINHQGLKTTRPSLVARQLQLNPGDPLSPTAITDTQRRLYDLGVFAKVDAAIQNPDGDTDRKYVVYNMEEAARYSVGVGFGAEFARIGGCQTCLDAPAGQAGFSPRVSLDVTRINLWGAGHTVSLRTRVSTLDRRALLNYSWPRFGHHDSLNVSFTGLYEDSRDVRTFNFKRWEQSEQLSQKVSKATTLFYRYTFRRVSVDRSTLKISPLLIPLLSQPERVGVLSFALIQDRRDDPVEPHRGIYNTLDLGLAEHAFGSQFNYVRFLARNATYHPIGKRFVLARSLEVGVIHALNNNGDPLNAIPLAERFFGGGNNSQRGFPDYQAGPRDLTTGFPIGGTALLFNQTELRFPLIGDNIGGVLFHDMGNIFSSIGKVSLRWSQHNEQDFNYTVHAVGFGIRYRTPIGPFRVDLAYSINPPYFRGFKANNQQDLVNAGVDPCVTYPAKCVLQRISHFQYFFSIGQTF
ncbi:MAG: BamA/TamA family outer membrane protein [Acidobacteria bacterium]|nr:BamA/TamA family outer membrane protein [Acidobacteriota bacterium]